MARGGGGGGHGGAGIPGDGSDAPRLTFAPGGGLAGIGRARRPLPPSPEQARNTELKTEMVDASVTSAADAKYDSMTPEEREKYYLHPSLWVRFRRFWKG